MASTIKPERDALADIWEDVTGSYAGPLSAAIIEEFIDGADPFTVDEVERVYDRLVRDVNAFARRIYRELER